MPRYERNYEKNGIEIYFDKKPTETLRDVLKANGWRWSSFNKCWYNYYSASNLNFAESLCGVDSNVLYLNKKKTKKDTSSDVISQSVKKEVKHTHFSNKEKVLVSFDDGKKYVGFVEYYLEDIREVEVKYITTSCSAGNITDSAWFAESKVKRMSSVMESSVYLGRVVSFTTSEGTIQKGEVVYKNKNANYDIRYYEISLDGEISIKEECYVSLDRIIQIEYGANVFPVKVGDKVEFESTKMGFVTGKITYINSSGSVDVEYECIDLWGDKDTTIDVCVSLEDIRILTSGKKILNRNLYITEEKQKSIDINEKIKERIRNRNDQFTDTNHLVQNRVLYRHQKAGVMLADMYDKFAFFYDTGTGKTVMALDIIMSKQMSDNAKFLIIAPKSIIKTAWMDDAAKYYPNLRILPLYKGFNAKKKRALVNSWRTAGRSSYWESDPMFYAHLKLISDVFELGEIKIDNDDIVDEVLRKEAKHYIVNSELFIKNPEYYIKELKITGIIMDESSILKNYNGKTAKVMRDISNKLKYVYLLSGKPAPNNVIEYFSQMKIVDPDTFSMSYDRFLNMFCCASNRNYYMLDENKNLFAEMVSIRSLIISKTDCLDLPETVDVVRQIELPDCIMQDYNELYRECMAIIKGMDNSEVFYSAQSKLAVLMKLRQMASGFFMTGSGSSRESKLIVDIHNEKIQELNSIIDQIEDEQVIVWCQFQHEIELVAEELSKRAHTVTAYGKTKDLEHNIDDFKLGRAKYIVAHPKTLKYGVTFVNCKYTIYYSFSYSAEDYDQSHDRNYRLGQTEMCTYIYIQSADTIDEIMYDKVMNKLSNAEFFERLIKDAARHGIDYDRLKEKDDVAIKKALSEDGGIGTITKDIISKTYENTSLKNVERGRFTTYDYLDRIEEPTDLEIQQLEEMFINKADWLFEGDGPYSDVLFDVSRSEYFDFIHADEPFKIFRKDMPLDEFNIFLSEQMPDDRWVYKMYRSVYYALLKMPSYNADVITMKYGIEDGKQRTLLTIATKFRRDYYTESGYTWNVARVSKELREGLDCLKESDDLEKIAGEIKRLFISVEDG